MKQSVGILAYGSLIANPDREIREVMIETKEGVLTPFPVEFARSSKERRGAPTLVPVEGFGAAVRAHLLILNDSAEDATDRLYRREINQVGSAKRYQPSQKPGPNTVVIDRLSHFDGIDVVLYTRIAANIPNLSAEALARLAIDSARGSNDGRDGISYLIDAKKYGIKTALSDAYEEQIKGQTGTSDLPSALRVARGQ